MGVYGWLLVEAKLFEFVVDEGVSILRIFERSKGILKSVFLGKGSGLWLETVKDMLQVEGQKLFTKTFWFGSRAFLAQQGSNKNMRFLALAEYEGGSWKGYLVILEGRGWFRLPVAQRHGTPYLRRCWQWRIGSEKGQQPASLKKWEMVARKQTYVEVW